MPIEIFNYIVVISILLLGFVAAAKPFTQKAFTQSKDETTLPQGFLVINEETSTENEQIEALLKEIAELCVQSSLISYEIKKAILDIYNSILIIPDENEKLINNLIHYYMPEIKKILEKYMENQGNREILELCQNTILKFSIALKNNVRASKDSKEIIETKTICQTFDSMMSLDGLIPDELQIKFKNISQKGDKQ